jgi:hypothetical protein
MSTPQRIQRKRTAIRSLIERLNVEIDIYETALTDPHGEVNEAAQSVAETCVELRKLRGWVVR